VGPRRKSGSGRAPAGQWISATGYPATPEVKAAIASGVLDRLPMFKRSPRTAWSGPMAGAGGRYDPLVHRVPPGDRPSGTLRLREPGGRHPVEGSAWWRTPGCSWSVTGRPPARSARTEPAAWPYERSSAPGADDNSCQPERDPAGRTRSMSSRSARGRGSGDAGHEQLVVGGVLMPDRGDDGPPERLVVQGSAGRRAPDPAAARVAVWRRSPSPCRRGSRKPQHDLLGHPGLQFQVLAGAAFLVPLATAPPYVRIGEALLLGLLQATSSTRMPCRSCAYESDSTVHHGRQAAGLLARRVRAASPAARKTSGRGRRR